MGAMPRPPEEGMGAMPRPPEVGVGDQSASERPLGMAPQPGKGGYKSLVNGPTPDGGYKCWIRNKAGCIFGGESAEMASPSESSIQLDAGKAVDQHRLDDQKVEMVGDRGYQLQCSNQEQAGRSFGGESEEYGKAVDQQ
eukprot:10650191-Karenia_brevis.AAC.2